MFLEKLLIQKTNGDLNNLIDYEIIREIIFKSGLNVITDNNVGEGNTVGKSTLLHLIDLCFGARNVDVIYENKYNKSNDNIVKKFLESYYVVVKLYIKDHLIIRPLFTNNVIFLDNKQYSIQDFNSEMQKILFNNNDNIPTFRNLMNKFIRLESNQIQSMLEFNHNSVTIEDKRLIRHFLFGYQNIDVSQKKTEIEKKLKQYKKNHQALKNINGKQLSSEINLLKEQINILEQQKEAIRHVNNVDKIIIEDTNIISQYHQIKNDLINKEYLIKHIEKNIETLSSKVRKIDTNILSNLYNEAVLLMGQTNIAKTFDDLIKFHNQGVKYELKYMTATLLEIQEIKKSLENQMKEISDKYISPKLFDELNNIMTTLSVFNLEIGKKEKELELYTEYHETIKKYREQLEQFITEETTNIKFEDQINRFNVIFANNYNKMFNKNPSVLYEREDGLLTINTNRERNGSGENIGEVIAFDLSYLQYIDELKLNFPNFQIHDQLEITDINAKRCAFKEILPDIDCQYIIATLHSSTDDIFNDDIILVLSQEDKLFRI